MGQKNGNADVVDLGEAIRPEVGVQDSDFGAEQRRENDDSV